MKRLTFTGRLRPSNFPSPWVPMPLQRMSLSVRTAGILLGLLAVGGCTGAAPEWTPLFNGEDLSGWTPKISGHALGEVEAEGRARPDPRPRP